MRSGSATTGLPRLCEAGNSHWKTSLSMAASLCRRRMTVSDLFTSSSCDCAVEYSTSGATGSTSV